MEDNDIAELDANTLNVDEINTTEIKINPDVYIHNAILKAQSALINPDTKAGFLQFRVLVENIEVLCRSSTRVPPDYDTKISDYKNTDDYKKETDSFVKSVNLAHKKLELLLTFVFASKISTQPLEL